MRAGIKSRTLARVGMAAMVLAMISLGATAQAAPDRVQVIRDDDGTADEGRGQVTSEQSVCRKTIALDADPATITRAWVMYFMKVRPYDVATRTLYDGPVEGVNWADLVIAVNGTEVLRGSLIEHGTMGWHELGIDPKVLVRGENQITMALDRGGSYFYLGIDRSNPLGRSEERVEGSLLHALLTSTLAGGIIAALLRGSGADVESRALCFNCGASLLPSGRSG